MRTPHNILRECALEAVEEFGRVRANEVLDLALTRYGAELQAVQEQAMRQGFLRTIKAILQAASKDDGVDDNAPAQFSLPGFKAPTAFPVPIEDGDFEYVKFGKMTWQDLQAAYLVRERNEARVQKRRLDLRQKMIALRPYIENYPTRTVEEAAQLYCQAQQQRHNEETL